MSNPAARFFRAAALRRRSAPSTSRPAVDELHRRGPRHRSSASPRSTRRPTWDNFVEPLDDANERLARAWAQVAHLNAVMNTPELREAYNAKLPQDHRSIFTELGQDQRLLRELQGACRARRASTSWPAARAQRYVENELRDFRLGGAELPPPQKARFLEIQEELAQLGCALPGQRARRDQRVRPLTSTTRPSSPAFPPTCCEAAREAAAKEGREGWKLTLHMPCYLPVMQYADNRGLRERMYRAYVTRASEFGKPEWDNTPLIAQILELRARGRARCSASARFAEVSLATEDGRHAARGARVPRGSRARAPSPSPSATCEELRDFARDELGPGRGARVGRGLRAREAAPARYAFSDQEVKQYFPEDEVLAGHVPRGGDALRPARSAAAQRRVWHPDVRFFEIRDATGALRRAVLPRPLRARRPSAAAHGWTMRSTAGGCGSARADAGRLPHLQLLRARRRQARALHARRGDHALPRVRPRPAPPAHAGRRAAACPASTASNGTRSSCPASSWRTSAGSGTCVAPMTRARRHGRAHPARALRQDARGEELPERPADSCASSSSRCSTCTCTTISIPARGDIAGACSTQVRARSRWSIPPDIQPLPEPVLAHLRRRLRGGLLQLQVGRGAVGGCLRRLRGGGRAQSRGRRALPPRGPRRRRQPPGARVLRRVPRPQAADRRASAS